jgi:hypothetical protein
MSIASDDDLLPGLPALDGGGDEDAAAVEGIDDDEDAPADETVGLDTETGTGEDDDDDLEGDDGETWTTDAEDSDLDDGDEHFGSEESGWTDDATAALEDDDDAEEPESASLLSDRGEEGLDEDIARERGDEAVDDAPPDVVDRASTGADDDADDLLNVDGSDTDAGDEISDEAGYASFEPARDTTLQVEHLGPTEDAIACVNLDGERLWAGGTLGLYHGRYDSRIAVRAEESEWEGVTSVAIESGAGMRIAIGTRLAGVRTSRDGGITFESANGWQRHAGDVEVALFVAGEGTRLWARTRSGALYRSDDFGTSWTAPVLLAGVRAFAVDGDGAGVAALVTSRGAAHLARSHDGGARWSMRAIPLDPSRAHAGGGELALATLGPVIAVAHPGDPAGVHVSMDDGATWIADASLHGACALALAHEEDGVALYAGIFQSGADRGLVVRRGAGVVSNLILDIAFERRTRGLDALGDSEGDQRIVALVARAEGGTTRIFAATGAGLFRVDRSRNGS